MEERKITLQPFQEELILSDKRFLGAIAGVQSGKSVAGAIWMALEINKDPTENFLICAPTTKLLEQSTLLKFFEFCPQLRRHYNSQRGIITLPQGGNVYIRSAERPELLEGMTIKAAWLDEAGQMKALVWIIIQARVAVKMGRIFITTTPYNLGWLYEDFYKRFTEKKDPDFFIKQWKSIDNIYFPKEEYERAQSSIDVRIFRRRYMAMFEQLEGLVYQDFDENNIIDRLVNIKFKEVIAGVDWGYENPSAIISIGLSTTNVYYVFDEYYQVRKTTAELIEQMKILRVNNNIKYFYPDNAEPDRIEEMKRAGLYARDVNKSLEGINTVRELIKSKQLRVLKSCVNTIDEFRQYVIGKDEKPKDEYNHALSGIRYAVVSHIPIKMLYQVREKDEERIFNKKRNEQ